MGIVFILMLTAGLAVFAISLGIAAIALGFAVGTLKSSVNHKISKDDIRNLGIFAAVLFVLTLVFLSNVDPRSRPQFVDWAILSYLVLIISVLSLSAVALLLRFFYKIQENRKMGNISPNVVIASGYAAIFLVIVSSGDFLLFKLDEPSPPLELALEGNPTHCVFSASGAVFSERSRNRGKIILRLEKGDKVRMNTTAIKVGSLGDTRFVLASDTEKKTIFGRGVFLKTNADGTCR